MIGWLRGRLAAKTPPTLVMDVHGVGYECEAPLSTFYGLPELGAEITLRTHLVVREDAHVLYAFASEDERRLFRALLKVSGVGPKSALGVLSGLSVADFLRVLAAEDTAALVRIPGVGRKTAERILIDLRDKAGDLGGTGVAFVPMALGAVASPEQEATVALIALGYRPQEVVKLLKAAGDDAGSTEELIRRALRAAAS